MSVCFSCFGSLLLDHVEQVDDAARADIGAVAAADALVIVDLGHEVLDLDGVRRALTLALHAADAADVADLARDGALVLIAAASAPPATQRLVGASPAATAAA